MKEKKFTPQKDTRKENSGFKVWFTSKAMPAMAKLGNQRHLAAIRDSFGTMIPLIIAGSIGVLVNAIIFGGAGSGYVSLLGLFAKAANSEMTWDQITTLLGDTTNGWGQASKIGGLAFGHMNTVTVGMMSIYFSFLFGYYIALSRGSQQAILTGLISISAFMLAGMGEVAFFMDAKGLLGAILFGLIASELFIKLCSVRALNIKLPDGVPPAVGKSFAVFLPAVITLAVIGVGNAIFLTIAIVEPDSGFIVTGNNQLTLAADATAVEGLLTSVKNLSDEDLMKLLGLEKLPDWIADFRSNLETNTFAVWYNAQNSEIQAQVAAIVIPQSANFGGSIFNPLEDNLLRFGMNGDNISVITGSYMSQTLGATQFGMNAAIYRFFTSWFLGFATGEGGIGLGVLFVFFVGFFWFFGVHGSNLMAGIFEPIFWMVLGINTALVNSLGYDAAAATGDMGVFTKPFFDSYMYVGGSGSTLGLLIMTLAVSKRRELKEVSKYAAPAGVFQINEPVIFGYPMVLNGMYAIPFIFAPILNLLVGWVFSPDVLDVVNYSYVSTPWTTPWFLSAVLTSIDPLALIPASIVLGISIAAYLPFVLLDNYFYFKKLKENDPEKYELEKRYYSDKLFKFTTDTETKLAAIDNRATMVLFDAETQIKFWNSRMTNKEKLELRTKDIQQKADLRNKHYLEKLELVKKQRAEKYKALEIKVQLKKEKEAQKAQSK